MLTTPNESQRHVVIAENELLEIPLPTYHCEFCGFSVKTKANLRAHHVKTHKILKTDADLAFFTKRKRQVTYIYHCPVVPCKHNIGLDAGFSTASRLKQHYQTVHMQRSYKCDRCGSLFATPSNHAYHMRFCGVVFTCPVCSRRYSFKKHLDQHFRRSGHRPHSKAVSTGKHSKTYNRISNNAKTSDSCCGLASTDCCIPATNTTSISNASPPLQTLVLPLVIMPVAFCGSNDFGQLTLTRTGNTGSEKMMVPAIFPDGVLPTNLLPGILMGNTASSVHSQVTNQTSLPQVSDFGQPVLQLANFTTSAGVRSCVDNSTQTEADSPPPVGDSLTNLVSVKTCTDEDDISSFIGSLFCDAGVEASFPLAGFDNESCTRLDCSINNEPSCQSVAVSRYQVPSFVPGPITNTSVATSPTRESDEQVERTPDQANPNSNHFFPFGPVDEEIQTGLLHSFEHASMQTDVIPKLNVSAATHDVPFHWNERSLETPPPFGLRMNMEFSQRSLQSVALHNEPIYKSKSMSPSKSGLLAIGTFLRGADYHPPSPSDTYNRKSSSIGRSPPLTHCLSGSNIEFDSSLVPSSHSIGLQSCPWSADREFCSIASQTLSHGWDSWFNSVHTQTSASSNLQSFSDMCVGVDDRFFDNAFDSIDVVSSGFPVHPVDSSFDQL